MSQWFELEWAEALRLPIEIIWEPNIISEGVDRRISIPPR